jgi:membrane-associated protein
MEYIYQLFDYFIHLDVHLSNLIATYGVLTYVILFLIIFCETGLVITPFLPGDSLLFAAGALAALGSMDIFLLTFILFMAAVSGDTVNYKIGAIIGPKVYTHENKFIKKEHLLKTHAFYEVHGGKTIIIARFLPIIRTFAPFVAGVGTMNYSRFIVYNIAGAGLWVAAFTFLGYFFGNIEFVKNHFSLIVLAIFLIPGFAALAGMLFQAKKPGTEEGK